MSYHIRRGWCGPASAPTVKMWRSTISVTMNSTPDVLMCPTLISTCVHHPRYFPRVDTARQLQALGVRESLVAPLVEYVAANGSSACQSQARKSVLDLADLMVGCMRGSDEIEAVGQK